MDGNYPLTFDYWADIIYELNLELEKSNKNKKVLRNKKLKLQIIPLQTGHSQLLIPPL